MSSRDPIAATTAVPVDETADRLSTDGGAGGSGQPGGQTDVGATVKGAAQQTQQRAGELVGKARQQSEQQITTQKDRAAEGLTTLASAIRRVGGEVRNEQQPQIADLAETAASQAERFGRFLRETDVNQLVRGVEDFARRQPALFLGGAVALGAVAARFLKASSEQATQQGTGQQDLYTDYADIPEPVARYETAGTTGRRQARG